MTSFDASSFSSLFSVKGKRCLVTGGGSGIGSYVAQGLAAGGATVYIVGRRQEKLTEVAAAFGSDGPGKIIPLPGDVSTKDSIEKLVKEYGDLEKTLDVLVNAAGILRVDKIKADPDDVDNVLTGLWSHEWGDWQDSMDVNVSALYYTSVGFAPLLRAAFVADPSTDENVRETPNIINISSIAGMHNARDAASVSYQVSKSAVHHLTKCLATRFLPLRIRVNCIAPGLFPSEMTTTDPVEIRNTHKTHFKAMPEGRAGAPADIVGPVVFLSSRAGAYMNGNVLDVGGGRSLLLSGAILPDAK